MAVRHAPDHIHLLATLARQDGRHPRLRGDIPKMHTAARAFEARWGLEAMSQPNRTARRAPATGEAEKAARRGLGEPARDHLQRTAREAAARATGTTDFLTRLRDAGLRVREHHDENGTLDGYAVALPGDRVPVRSSRPIWFSGRTLAYDLSLLPASASASSPPSARRTSTRHTTGSAGPPPSSPAPDAPKAPATSPPWATSWWWPPRHPRPPYGRRSERRQPRPSRPPAPRAPAPSRALPAPGLKPPPAPWNTPPGQPGATAPQLS